MHPADLVIPRPARITVPDGEPFVLAAGARILADQPAVPAAGLLASLLRPATGFALPIVGDRLPGDIALELGATEDYGDGSGPEHYSLAVGKEGVVISALSPAGLFHGVQTLRQLFPEDVESTAAGAAAHAWTVPAVDIEDGPRFGYRGIMLDVARSFFTVEEVKQQIDTMSQFKLNVLHLHLTDDQGWRIEIKNPPNNPSSIDYARLTDIGGAGAVDHPGVGLSAGHSGYYTQDALQELAGYAAARNVLLVPEIDVPGHVNAALASIPQLNADGAAKPMNSTGDVGYSTLDADNPVTREFVREVFTQLAAMSPGPYLHIGGDEAHVTGHDSYLAMVTDFSRIATGLGKSVIGWSEYAEAQLPAGAVIQYWHGDLDPVRRQAGAGAKVIMSPAARTYLDQKYDPASPIGLQWVEGGPFTWAEYYDWDPAAQGVDPEHVLGVEAPLWTETVRGNDQAAWLLYPRAISIAEVGWSAQENRHLDHFRRRLGTYGARLARQGITFQAAPDVEWAAAPPRAFPGLFMRADTVYGRIDP